MLHFDTPMQSNTATYTLEQYVKETEQKRKNTFLDMVLSLVLIGIGTIGLWAVV